MVSSSPITPTTPELRRRSFPAHILQAHQKEAAGMVKGKDGAGPPSDETEPQLSFVQKYFYRVSDQEAEDNGQDATPIRRFSLMSRGSLIAIAFLSLMVIVAVLCAVLATVYEHHRKKVDFQHSPIKQAIFANFPDPAIVEHNGTWYAFATTNAAGILAMPHNISSYEFGTSNVQIATSHNYVNWTLLDSTHDPLPVLGNWVTRNKTDTKPSIPKANVWAPEILQRPGDGKFVMYYSALVDNATRAHCVGAAVSDSGPAGPYTPLNETIACPTHEGGAIDPVSFVDVDDSIYVAWKVDGNNAGHGGVCGNTVPPLVDTPIRLLKMQADGTTPDGEAITIMNREKSDGPLVEAPSLVRSDDGLYFLFFSSGCTRAPSYDVKFAWAHNITGPYTRAEYPLLQTGDFGLLAPGSIGIRRSSSGEIEMAFHARVTTSFGRVRAMYTSRIQLNGTDAVLIR